MAASSFLNGLLIYPICSHQSPSAHLFPLSFCLYPSANLLLPVYVCPSTSACILLPAYDHQSDSANFLGRCAATGMFLHFVAPYYEMF
jgi:hypothetical protein